MRLAAKLIHLMDANELNQYNTVITHKNAILDLAFSNNLDLNVQSSIKATLSTHDAIEISTQLDCKVTPIQCSRTVYNYKKTDFGAVMH